MQELNDLFVQHSINIRAHVATRKVSDPNYNTKTKTPLNPYPLKALILSRISAAKAIWKMPGQNSAGGLAILVKKAKKTMVEATEYFVIDGIRYYGYRSGGKFLQTKEWGNYLYILLYRDETE